MSPFFRLRSLLCLVLISYAAGSVGLPLLPYQSADYEHWCGLESILELPDTTTARKFIEAQDDQDQFVRDGRFVLVREQPSSAKAIPSKSHFWKGKFFPVRHSPRDELYWISTKPYASPPDARPIELAVNDEVWKKIGAVQPVSSIPSTRRPRVAVLDTDIFEHQQFERDRMAPPSLVRRYSLDPADPGTDCDGDFCCRRDDAPADIRSSHGTQVAGLIAAADDGEGMSGLGEVEQLLSISILDPSRLCFSRRRLVAAYKCAVQQGADIINISMETERDRAYPKDLKVAIRKNQSFPMQAPLVVVAAGNRWCRFNEKRNCGVWPGGMDLSTILSVEALDLNGARLPSSNRGKFVDLGVPVPVVCTTDSKNPVPPFTPACDNGYIEFGETSAAAAIASGAATRIWGHPNFDRCSAAQLRRVLRGYGEPTPKKLVASGELPSCQLKIDFLYTVKRDVQGKAIDLCACPEMTTRFGCGDLRRRAPLCGGRIAKKSPRR